MVRKSIVQLLNKEVAGILTLKETAEYLRVHPNTLRNWDRAGLLKSVRYGTRKDRRYMKEDVLKFIKNNLSAQDSR
jgi:excisionase family DNA binding protein